MKDCEKYQEMISAMLDGELNDNESAQLRQHMAGCPQCRAMYEAFAAVSGVVAEDLPEVPAQLHEHIMSGVKKSAGKKGKKSLIIRLRPYMTAVACLVVIIAAVLAARQTGILSAGSDSSSANAASAPTAADAAAPQDANYDTSAQYTAESELEEVTQDDGNAPENNSPTSDNEADAAEKAEDEHTGAAGEDIYPTEPEAPPAPTPEPVKLDIVESVVTVEADGKLTSEKLNSMDTTLWLTTVIEGPSENNGSSAGFTAASIVVTPEDGQEYTAYLYYDAGQLMCSLNDDLTDSVKLNTLADFAKLAEKDQ